jgi:hypothetical protein
MSLLVTVFVAAGLTLGTTSLNQGLLVRSSENHPAVADDVSLARV